MDRLNFSKIEQVRRNLLEPIVRKAIKGEVDNHCMTYRKRSAGKPEDKAWCPACKVQTWWRGPHPQVKWDKDKAFTPDPPLIKKGRYQYTVAPRQDETREAAAARLYRLADKWDKGPMPMYSVKVDVWQGALCSPCEKGHMHRWMEAVAPTQTKTETTSKGTGKRI